MHRDLDKPVGYPYETLHNVGVCTAAARIRTLRIPMIAAIDSGLSRGLCGGVAETQPQAHL
jgi:hypothetical protein